MRLSVVFELLLIFLIIAFAASRVIDPKSKHRKRLIKKGQKQMLKQAAPNKYCTCSTSLCNCCREFNLPVIQMRGPGCATVSFLKDNEFGISMKFGDRVLRNITLSGRSPRPVCMGLPGGVSKFCGRVYGFEKQEEQFKACLGLELRSLEKVEAALRVSCFRFGPGGVRVEPAEPFPESTQEKVDEDEDEDDDDDDYGIDDDDDDDDDDYGLSEDDDDDDDDDTNSGEDAADNDVDSVDYTGFSALSDEFLDGFFGSDSANKKKKKPTNLKPASTVSSWPVRRPGKKPKPVRTPAAGIAPTTSRNKIRVTTPKVSSTTEKFMPPSSPPTVMETPIETTEQSEDETEEPTEDEKDADYVTSTMMTITSMQVLHDKDQEDESAGDVMFTTTDQTTTEEQTEQEEMKPTDRVAAIKELENIPKASFSVANDENSDEEEEEEDDDDDDDDVDMTSLVGAGLLNDDDEDPEDTASHHDTKERPVPKDTIGMLEGFLDDMDVEDEDDEKNKAKDKQRNIPSSVEPITDIQTTYQTSEPASISTETIAQPSSSTSPIMMLLAANQTEQSGINKLMTPPPLGGMRLYFSDPRHPPKGRSPLSARSGREHRRMRLPSMGTEVIMT